MRKTFDTIDQLTKVGHDIYKHEFQVLESRYVLSVRKQEETNGGGALHSLYNHLTMMLYA